MKRKKGSNKVRVNFLLDKQTYEDFSLICEELGLVRSKNVEHHLRQFIEVHADLLKKLKNEKK